MSTIRMSGMISGLDTEALVQAMVQDKVERKNKYQKAQTKLEWKQEAYKGINTKVYSLYNKIGNMRFTSAYALKKTTASDNTKVSVTASGTATNGTQSIKITNLAKAGYLTGAKLDNATENTTLGQLGFKDGSGSDITGDATFTVTVGSKSTDITVNKDTKISEVVEKLKSAGVNASFDAVNGRFFVSSKETGKANDFSLTGTDEGLYALKALGLNAGGSKAELETYQKVAGYAVDASGNPIYTVDEDGKYVLTGTYDKAVTRTSIENILNNLQNAKDNLETAKTSKKTLQDKVNYSENWDKIEEFKTTASGTDEQKAKLLYLLQEKDDNNKYQSVNADGVVVTDYEFAGNIDAEIKKLAKECGIWGDEEDTSEALNKLKANVKAVGTVFEDFDGSAPLKYIDKTASGRYVDSADLDDVKEQITNLDSDIAAYTATINDPKNTYWEGKTVDEIMNKIDLAVGVLNDPDELAKFQNTGATKVNGEDSIIELNGAEFTSSSNTYNINGLTIKALALTAPGEEVSINTDTDTQGIYDKVKDLLTEYNEVMKELSTLYNADSAKGYEPLTEEEKEKMSDSEVEKWEKKVRDSILRRDSTIGGIMDTMSIAMQKAYTINGKSYTLASFGIHTMGILNSAKNEGNLYHIDGDEDDATTAGNADKLMNMIQNNPDDTVEFLKDLADGLYSELDKKMKSTSLNSAYTIYNDKQIDKDITNYKKLVKTWEDKIADLEDRYYKQFSRMETQLSQMQSSTSSLSGLFGNQ